MKTKLIPLFIFLFFLALYFYTNSGGKSPPTKYQRVTENLWLLFRRIICYVGSAAMLFASYYTFFLSTYDEDRKLHAGISFLVIAILFAYASKRRDIEFNSSMEIYTQNKNKYK